MVESVLYSAVRAWVSDEHLRNILQGEWTPMYDSDGKPLKGIRGRVGAVGTSMHGLEVGVDLIEMQPGTAFDIHVHDGDHVLYVESGQGSVFIDGERRSVKRGDTIFIAAEFPHGVQGPPSSAKEPLLIVAFGHPHTHVDSKHRMRHPHSHDHPHRN
jgi:quercetin dioxygenase-like cupin family protein